MLILGLLLVIAAVALAIGAVFDAAEPATVEVLGSALSTTVAGVFFAGMATTALLLFGIWLMQSSVGRARKRRQERKAAKVRQRESVQSLESERAELRAENERLAQKLADEQGSTGDSERSAGGGTRGSGTSTSGMGAAPGAPAAPGPAPTSSESTDLRRNEDTRQSRDI